MRSILALAALAAASLVPLGAAADAPSGAPIDGIQCQSMEGSAFHIHQHLALFGHGKPIGIPGDVGQSPAHQCLYWLHTHTPDGLIHDESPVIRSFTLGNFFDVWGEPLSATRVADVTVPKGAMRVWVDGQRYAGDPRGIPLATHTTITIEAGAPYHTPAPFTDWQGQ